MSQSFSPAPTILRRMQVQARTGLSRSTLYQYVKDGHFPSPVLLGLRAVGWRESDVNHWIDTRVTVTRAARKPMR